MKRLILILAVFATSLAIHADADQPTYDFDFGSLLFGPPTGDDQQTTLAVDSFGGNDANAGTLQAPKLTLPASLASNEKLGLYRGSRFRTSLPLGADMTLNGISVRGLSLVPGALPVLSALDPVVSSAWSINGDGTYSYTWPAETGVANDGYQNVYVVEINTASEATSPIASRRRMTDVTSQATAAATAGTAYVQSLGGNQWKATLRPTDSLAPSIGGYRYEVVSRFCPVNYGPQGATGDCSVSGLELVGGSYGYGALAGPTAFVGDRLAILHASTHGAVLGGGSLQRSVFYEGGDADSIMLAWYTGDPAGLSWSMNNVLFYGNVGDRCRDMLIAHSSGSTNYERGDITDCAFLGARWSDGSLHSTAFSYTNVLAGTIERVFVAGVAELVGNNAPLGMEIKHSVFREVGRVRLPGSFRDNILLSANLGNSAGPGGIILEVKGQSAVNNLIWSRATGAAGSIFLSQSATQGTVSRNVAVLDQTSAGDACYAAFASPVQTGMAMDYNLVIQTGGSFRVFGTPSGTKTSWADYRAAFPTLDAHSKFVDLSGDPRGLKAVFVDPLNGDFRWAQTDVGQQCATYCQANHVGPVTVTTRWPLVPTVDEAVAAISLLPPKITSPGAVTFTKSANGAYQITTDLDGTQDAPTSYNVAGQPSWLGVNASSGLMSGTPPQTGNFGVSVSATNRAGTGSAALGITVQTAFMAWQRNYFTAAELNDPAISGPYAVPAGDGIPNLMKYALGLNPKSDGSGALPKVSFMAVGEAKFLTLTYNRSLAASDVTYTVEVSGDLQTWSAGANATATVSTTTDSTGAMQMVVQRDLTPTSSAGRRFIRLRINQQ